MHDVRIEDAFVRIDDRHFSMSGSAEDLGSDACAVLGADAQLSKLVQKAVTLLLDAQ